MASSYCYYITNKKNDPFYFTWGVDTIDTIAPPTIFKLPQSKKYFQKSVFFTGFLQLYYILSIPQLEERSCRMCRKGIEDSLGCIEGGRHDRQILKGRERRVQKKKFGNLVKITTFKNIFLPRLSPSK